jgi:peptidoglycan-N-acetylglucosamine deacetylase
MFRDTPSARRTILVLAVAAVALTPEAAATADCPGRPHALGTFRAMTVDPREFPRIGTMQYTGSLPLNDKEVVLTFDDGPMPPYTNRVLNILAEHCVKATFFVIGRMARGYPEPIRRMLAEGHTVGTHSENHVLAFDRMTLPAVQKEIEQGIASVAAALGKRDAVAPFFRIPGLLRATKVEGYLQSRGLITWSADLTGDDWKHISASEVVRRIMDRLADKGKGIVLLHDIQPATALALPELLRAMKSQGYRIVQVVPARTLRPVKAESRHDIPATAASAIQAFAREAPADLAPPAVADGRAARRRLDPDHATDSVASATPPRQATEAARPALPEQGGAVAAAHPKPAPAAGAPSRSPNAHTVPRVRRASQRGPANAGPVPVRPATRPAARFDSDTVARPLSSGLKPPQGAKTPGKIDVLRLEAPPNIVSIPVPQAGGVGVSALARSDRTSDDGRFQLGN